MKPLIELSCDGSPQLIRFSMDGSRLLTINEQAQVVIWDIEQRTMLNKIDVDGGILDAAFLPDSDYLVLATRWEHGDLHIIRLIDNQITATLKDVGANGVIVTPDTGIIIAGRAEDPKYDYVLPGYLSTYDHQLNLQMDLKVDVYPSQMALTNDAKTLVAEHGVATIWRLSDEKQWVLAWDSQSLFQNAQLQNGHCETTSIAISADGRYVAAGFWGCQEGKILVIDVEKQQLVGWFAKEFEAGISAVALSQTGQYVIGAGVDKQEVWVWHRETGRLSHKYNILDCQAIALSPLRNQLAIGSKNSIGIWPFTK